MTRLRWRRIPGDHISAPLSVAGDYVISHRERAYSDGEREGQHTVSFRPPGEHHHVGMYPTEKEAKRAAAEHHRAREAAT